MPISEKPPGHDFSVGEPNRVWIGDITRIVTDEGWLYPVAIIGLFNRRGVGRSLGHNAVTETLFGSLKVERPCGERYVARRHAKDDVPDRLTIYNRKQIYSTLGYIGPMKFEVVWSRRQQALAT